jgi:hypothetical protein
MHAFVGRKINLQSSIFGATRREQNATFAGFPFAAAPAKASFSLDSVVDLPEPLSPLQ